MKAMISIVIPMYNEEQHIERTLAAAGKAAEHAGLVAEFIVVDNQSSDGGAVLASRNGARVLSCPDMRVGALRNAGAAIAEGDWLAFLDADIEVPENWLVAGLQALEQGADVVSLDCDTPRQAPWFARVWQKRSMSQTGKDRHPEWMPTPNLLMARSTFNSGTGFDEHLSSGEDKAFGLMLHAAKKRQAMLASPVALHWGYERSWSEWIRKEFWRQSSHIHLFREQARFRLLRFPLLCLWTTFFSLLMLLALLEGEGSAALMLAVPALIPAALFAWRQSSRKGSPGYSLQLMVLHWLRMLIGTAALFKSLFSGRKK